MFGWAGVRPRRAVNQLANSSGEASAPPGAEAAVGEAACRWGIIKSFTRLAGAAWGWFRGQQLSLDRHVALKILPFAAALDPKQLQRFKTKAQAAAHLHHTNIVPIFGVGCERGIRFLRHAAHRRKDASGRHPGVGRASPAQSVKRKQRPRELPGGPLRPNDRPAVPLSFVRWPIWASRRPRRWPTRSRGGGPSRRQAGQPAARRQGQIWVADFGLAHFQDEVSLTLHAATWSARSAT